MVGMNKEDGMNTRWIQRMGVAAALAVWMGAGAGCEEAETDTGLSIDPPSAAIAPYGDGAVLLSACRGSCCGECLGTSSNMSDRLLLPLEWSVHDPRLGRVTPGGGFTAVYQSTGGDGQNIVFVRDQGGREGMAVIQQAEVETPEPGLVL